jgi:hypothetical protein
MTPDPPERASTGGAGALSPDARSRLLDAWAAWDAKPGAQATANEMVDAVRLAAGELSISALAFHDALAAARRIGMDRAQALDHVLSHLPAEQLAVSVVRQATSRRRRPYQAQGPRSQAGCLDLPGIFVSGDHRHVAIR